MEPSLGCGFASGFPSLPRVKAPPTGTAFRRLWHPTGMASHLRPPRATATVLQRETLARPNDHNPSATRGPHPRRASTGTSAYGLPPRPVAPRRIAGSQLAPVVVRRFGQPHVLLVVGSARALWLPLYPLAPHGPTGPVIIMAADTAMLTCAGAFNPAFVACRTDVTAAVRPAYAPAWGISAETLHPLSVLLGGGLAAPTGVGTHPLSQRSPARPAPHCGRTGGRPTKPHGVAGPVRSRKTGQSLDAMPLNQEVAPTRSRSEVDLAGAWCP